MTKHAMVCEVSTTDSNAAVPHQTSITAAAFTVASASGTNSHPPHMSAAPSFIYEIDHCTAFGPCSARGITTILYILVIAR